MRAQKSFILAMIFTAAPAIAAPTPQEQAMCGGVVMIAQMAHQGSGLESYWTKEAERVLDATIAAYRKAGLTGQKAEDAAFAEIDRVRSIIAEDLVTNFVDGLYECKSRNLVTLK